MGTEADSQLLRELRTDVKALHSKLDEYNEQTIKNANDIGWLKKVNVGSVFTYIGAIIYSKFGS